MLPVLICLIVLLFLPSIEFFVQSSFLATVAGSAIGVVIGYVLTEWKSNQEKKEKQGFIRETKATLIKYLELLDRYRIFKTEDTVSYIVGVFNNIEDVEVVNGEWRKSDYDFNDRSRMVIEIFLSSQHRRFCTEDGAVLDENNNPVVYGSKFLMNGQQTTTDLPYGKKCGDKVDIFCSIGFQIILSKYSKANLIKPMIQNLKGEIYDDEIYEILKKI